MSTEDSLNRIPDGQPTPRRALAKPRDPGGGAPNQEPSRHASARPGDGIAIARGSGTSTEFNYPQDPTATASAGVTPSQTVGPFFHYALPYETGPEVAGAQRPGAIRLSGRVLDGAGEPIPDAMVEIWQADEFGQFVATPGIYDKPGSTGFRGLGRCPTGADGTYEFRTVKPAEVTTVDERAQAPHIAMAVFARGMLRQAVTRVYFDDEPSANSTDPLLSGLEEDRRATMVATSNPDGYHFDVRVQGESETVFLDVFER